MARFREEAHTLHSFVVSAPSVQPFLRNEAIMLFLAQITGGFNEAACRRLIHILSAAVVNGRCLVSLLHVVLLLGLLESSLAARFELLDYGFLLWCHLCHLSRELLHALVGCPRSFKISRGNVTLLLPLYFNFSALLLPRNLSWVPHRPRVERKSTI